MASYCLNLTNTDKNYEKVCEWEVENHFRDKMK